MPLSLREKLQKASRVNLATNAAKTVGKLTLMEQPAVGEAQSQNKPTQQPTHKPTDQTTQLPSSQPTNHDTLPVVDPETHQPTQPPTHQPTVPVANPQIHLQADPQDTPLDNPGFDAGIWDMLTTAQRKVLVCLAGHPGEIIRYASIAADTRLSIGTIQTIFKRFKALGLLSSHYGSRGIIKGMRFTLDRKVYGTTPQNFPQDHLPTNPVADPLTNQPSSQPTHQPSQNDLFVLIDREKNLSISLTVLETTWPALAKTGFGLDQLRQIVETLGSVGKSLDRLLQGLDHIEYELTHGQLVDKEGQAVADPCSWAFSALAQNGYYRRPKGYVSPEEQALCDAEAEAKAVLAARQRAETARFEAWKAGLSEEELAHHLSGHPGGPKDAWLRHVWKEGGGR